MIFSTNEYVGTRHPDYNDLNDYDPDGPLTTEKQFKLDTYGSVRDYWNEVSYGNLQIQAYQTRSGLADKYHTGIVNKVISANGKNYVRWIKLDYIKSTYGINSRDPISDAISKIRALHQLPTNDPEYIEFDIDSYPSSGKIAVITAGGRLGGWAYLGGQDCIVPEKMQYLTNNDRYAFLSPVGELAHEFGHTIGLPHYVGGSFELMFWGGFSSRQEYFSPPHINPKDKMSYGWIPSANVYKVGTNTSLQLPPINSSPVVALMKLYGDGGRDNDYTHSEYLIVEYRKREGFNRFTGGTGATGFTGGGLIWHYSEYSIFPVLRYNETTWSTAVDNHIGLKVVGYDSTFRANPGDPSQLFYPNHSSLTSSTTPNSGSAGNLTTGLNLNSFSYSGGNLVFNVSYDLGTPPAYDYFVNSSFNTSNNNLSGKVYIESYSPSFSALTFASGTQIDFAPNATLNTAQLTANATSQSPITFDGAGFSSYRNKWNELQVYYPSGSSVINYCNLKNSNGGLHIYYPTQAVTISNSTFQNNTTRDILFDKGVNSNNATFPTISNNNTYAKLKIIGNNWTTGSSQTLTIPSGAIFEMAPSSSLKFGSYSGITSYGRIQIIGTSSQPITLTTSTTGGTWSGITISGSGANNSQLSYATINSVLTYGGSALIVNGATGATIDHCTITNNVNYGTNGILLLNAGSPNVSYNTISNNGSYGIRYQNTSGDVWKNTIQNNAYGGVNLSNSSPNFGHSGFYAYNGNNTITDGSYGVYATYYSYPFVGSQYNSYYGYNSISNNSIARISATSYSEVLAEQNWWGSFPPSSSWFQQDGTSLIEYNPALESAPGKEKELIVSPKNEKQIEPLENVATGTNSILSETISMASNSIIREFWDARDAMLRGEPERAVEILTTVIQNSKNTVIVERGIAEYITLTQSYPDNKKIQAAFSLLKNKISQSNIAKIYLARLYSVSGDLSQASLLYQTAKGNDYTKTEFKLASLNEFYDNLLYGSVNTAKQNLAEIQKHFKDDAEVKEAAWLFDLVKDKPIEIRNNNNNNGDNIQIASNNAVIESRFENYPNPFNPTTTIAFSLPEAGNVHLAVYDYLGREVKVLIDGYRQSGKHEVQFNATRLASGVYYYSIQSGNLHAVRKMLLLK
jgi:M6 family metalloprotease-like protein